MKLQRKYVVGFIAILIVNLIDRILKRFFVNNPDAQWDFFDGWISFQFSSNTGIAFSIPLPNYILMPLVIIVSLFLIRWLVKSIKQNGFGLNEFLLSAVIVGAGSNISDRAIYGYVVDYISIPYFTIFNFADIMIVAGVGLILLQLLRAKEI